MKHIDNSAWEHFSHDADIGIRGHGSSLEEAFEMGAMALTGAITDPEKVFPVTTITVSCSAPDNELLFVDWLNSVIYEMDTREMLFSRFHVKIHDSKLTAEISGEPINREKHEPAVDIKGATLTELKVNNNNGVWTAQCVVDV